MFKFPQMAYKKNLDFEYLTIFYQIIVQFQYFTVLTKNLKDQDRHFY